MSKPLVLCVFVGLIVAGCAESKEMPLPECTQGEVRCDPTETKELVCEEGANGKFSYAAKSCPPGTKCDPATGRCPDLCGECNTPPSDCHQREGTCWKGECQYEPAEGLACDDGDACTLNDICHGGSCRAGSLKECSFVPADECADSMKLKAFSATGRCESGDCVYPSTVVDCPLGCDNGKCKGDPCQGVTCDDPPSACHKGAGVCNNGTCTYLPDDGKSCDDQDACTEDDACSGGKCDGKPKVCDTPPADTCKDANTLTSYAAKGTCKAGTCSYEATEVACERGCDAIEVACKGDPCDGVTCDSPSNACYKDTGTCNDEGKCDYAPDNGKTCDDGDACTTGDDCSDGVCKGEPVVCNTPPKNACKDADTLTVFTAPGICNAQGTCDYGKAEILCPNGCDDVTGGCLGDPCASVTCDSPPNDQCYTVPGICSGGTCIYLPKSGVDCDDGDPCTKDDVCLSGDCDGTPYTCQDTLVCTTNQCDGTGGCSYPLQADACLIKIKYTRTCFEKDELNAANSCQLCNPVDDVLQSYWGVVTGTEVTKWDFDDATLQGWTVTVNPDNPTTTVKWQVDDQRATSGTQSVYFGDVTTRLYDDGSNAVSGTLTSPAITIPSVADGGKLCLEFKMFKHGENNSTWDAVTLSVIDATVTTQVWHSGEDAEYGNTYEIGTSGAFVSYSADISAVADATADKEIQVEFLFDSLDGLLNDREGVYLDDVRVVKNCTP